jgi:hypothetical protein
MPRKDTRPVQQVTNRLRVVAVEEPFDTAKSL